MRSAAVKAFDLTEEKDALRDKYGRNLFGQGCPLARRLVERGVPFAVASGHDAGTIDAAFSAGLTLAKPFGFETFRQAVERLLPADPAQAAG